MLWVRDGQEDYFPPRPSAPTGVRSDLRWDYMGTHAFYMQMGISAALDWQEEIGGLARKQARLSALTHHWMKRIEGKSMTVAHAPSYGAVALLRSEKYKAKELLQLLQEGGFHAKVVGSKSLAGGVRISTNLFVTEHDLDRMADHLIAHH